MTLSKFNLQKSMLNFSKSKEDSASVLSGVLGLNLETVQVPNRAGFVYVRLRDNLHEVIEAYNGVVSPVYNLPVLLRWDKTRYMIVGRDLERYVSWGTTSSYLPLHGASHAFSESGAGDVVWVYSRQFMPWLITPSGSSAADSGMVQGYPYYFESRWKYLATTGTPSLIGNKPTGSLGARMSLLYLDQKENIMKLTAGTIEFDASLTGTADIMPYVPAIAQDWHIPLAGVRVVTGTATISWGNLYDLRPHFTSPPTGTGGGGADLTGFTDGSIIFVESEEAAEDNDNLFYDNANNTLFLGGAGTPAPILSSNTREIIQGDGGTGPEIRTANDAAYPYLITARARGSLASPTAVVSGDVLARINHYGYDGSAYVDKARHDVFATENWSNDARGTKIQVRTTPTGTAGTSAVAEWKGTGLSLLKGIQFAELYISGTSTYNMDGENTFLWCDAADTDDVNVYLPPATNGGQFVGVKMLFNPEDEDGASTYVYPQDGDTIDFSETEVDLEGEFNALGLVADGNNNWNIVFNLAAGGIAGSGLTAVGSIINLGTPSTITSLTTNLVTGTSHTHALGTLGTVQVSQLNAGGSENVPAIIATADTGQTIDILRVTSENTPGVLSGFGRRAAMFLGSYTTQSLSAGDQIDPVNPSYIKIQGSSGNVILTSNPQIIAGDNDGQIMILEGVNSSQPITIVDGNGVKLKTAFYKLYASDWITLIWDDDNSVWSELNRSSPIQKQTWPFRSLISGSTYALGFYDLASPSNDLSPSVYLGTTNTAYGAKVFVVLGEVTDNELTIRVNGTEIQSTGATTTNQNFDIVIPASAAVNSYYETDTYFTGRVSLTVAGGTPKLCNYGFVRAWNAFTDKFKVTGLGTTWLGGATDTEPDLLLRHHKNTGWTFVSGSSAIPPTALASMATDYGDDKDITINEQGSWYRDNLSTLISGSSQGLIFEAQASVANTFALGSITLQYRSDW